MKNKKPTRRISLQPLETGQIWRMAELNPGGARWEIAGALQTRQARCRPDPDFRQRQTGRGEISKKEQGGFDSRINCPAGLRTCFRLQRRDAKNAESRRAISLTTDSD